MIKLYHVGSGPFEEPFGAQDEKYKALVEIMANGHSLTPVIKDGKQVYENVPAGATIVLNYAFSLADPEGVTGVYAEDDYFRIPLPAGVNFEPAFMGEVKAVDDGNEYALADWEIVAGDDDCDYLVVKLVAEGVALGRWNRYGQVGLSGKFVVLGGPGEEGTKIEFGDQIFFIEREPYQPPKSTIVKDATYDAITNVITWTININPPEEDEEFSYAGFELIDVFSDNQEFVPGSFTVGETSTALPEGQPNKNGFTYIFPSGSKGPQTITYGTKPTGFGGNRGATFSNTADLKYAEEQAVEKKAEKTLTIKDLIKKIGEVSTVPNDTKDVVLWTVTVKIPADFIQGDGSLGSMRIIDQLQKELVLMDDDNHKVKLHHNDNSEEISKDTRGDHGYYIYSPHDEGDTLTYYFADGHPEGGVTYEFTFYTEAKNKQDFLNTNNAISFDNTAKLVWETIKGVEKQPSYPVTIGSGVGAGGLIKKSAGARRQYKHGDEINWTIVVNENAIEMSEASVEDVIPAGLELVTDSINVSPELGVSINHTNPEKGFTITFPDPIHEKYTIKYTTTITNLDDLYNTNGDVTFTNQATLYRSGETLLVSPDGKQTFESQMINKAKVSGYDYENHLVQWKIVVNRNQLPLKNAVLTDTLPVGMELYAGVGKPFVVTKLKEPTAVYETEDLGNVGVNGSFAYIVPSDDTPGSFTFTFDKSIEDEYTVIFWTYLPDSQLKERWNPLAKTFTNEATLTADEIGGNGISHSADVTIKNPVVDKSGKWGGKGDDADTIFCEVVINHAHYDLDGAIITDTLHEDLELDEGSVELYEVGIEVNNKGDFVVSTGDPVDLNGDALRYNREENFFTVSLPKGRQAYLLKFASFITNIDTISFSNEVSMSGTVSAPEGTVKETGVQVTENWASGASGSSALTVIKKDGQKLLPGTLFRLLVAGQQFGGSARTDGDGKISFNKLPSWVFSVEEIEPVYGYLLPRNPITSVEKLKKDTTVNVEINNELVQVDIEFDKVGARGKPLSGGKFVLTGEAVNGYRYEGDQALTAVADGGKVKFPNILMPKGGTTYLITEELSPEGHDLSNDSSFSVTVDYATDATGATDYTKVEVKFDKDTNKTVVNEPKPIDISFRKTDESGQGLKGGKFTLIPDAGTLPPEGSQWQEVAPNDNGLVSFSGLSIGDYTIVEVEPPFGYIRPGGPPEGTPILDVTVEYGENENGNKVLVYYLSPSDGVIDQDGFVFEQVSEGLDTFSNVEAVANITIYKITSGNSPRPLRGGRFGIYEDDTLLQTQSADDGAVIFTNIPVQAENDDPYVIKEISPPSGYQRTRDVIEVMVKYNTDKTAVDVEFVEGYDKYQPEDNGDEYPAFRNTRVPYVPSAATAQVLKVDEDGKALEGAVFTLYNAQGEAVATAVSDSKGIAEFVELTPGAEYSIVETEAPEGYVASDRKIAFEAGDGALHEFRMVNTKDELQPGTIVIEKTDDGNTRLEGASFGLYNAAGVLVATATTNSKGVATFADVPVGVYTIRELGAPEGYIKSDESQQLAIEGGDQHSLRFVNKPEDPKDPEQPKPEKKGSLSLVKINSEGEGLAGAEFSLFDASGRLILRLVSNANGVVRFSDLPLGTYIVQETKAPAGYRLFGQALAIELAESDATKAYRLRNVREDEEDEEEWEEIEDEEIPGGPADPGDPKDPEGELPKTGGIPHSFLWLALGLSLVTAGGLILKGAKKERLN